MKRGCKIFLILATFTSVLVLGDAAVCSQPKKEEESILLEAERRREPKRPELTDERIEHIMRRLREENPERAKELERLRKDEPEKFRKAMREEFGGRARGPRRGRRLRKKLDEYFEWVQENFPERAERLVRLKEEKPEDFNKYLERSYRRYRRIFEASKENPELAKILKEGLELRRERKRLLRRIKTESSDEVRKDLTEELEEVVSDRFNLIVRWKRIEYEQLLEKLERLKREIEESKAEIKKWERRKEENVKERVEGLLSGKRKFRWD